MKQYFWHKKPFKRYLEQNWQRLYRIAYAWSHQPHIAHDLLQETMNRVMREHHHFENDKALDVWLYKTMANCWRDQCRRQKDLVDIDESTLYSASNLEADQYRRELNSCIQMAMGRLNMTHRQIITLIDLEGLSYNEVANILDIPAGTVMSRLCRARQQLREYVQEAGFVPGSHEPNLRRIK